MRGNILVVNVLKQVKNLVTVLVFQIMFFFWVAVMSVNYIKRLQPVIRAT